MPSADQPVTSPPKPTIGLAHFSALPLPPDQFVAAAANAGFSHVGLRLHPVLPGGIFYELPPGSTAARELLKQLVDEGVQVYDIETVVIDPGFDPPSLLPILDAARALGARRLSVCGDDPDRARLVSNFAALCELAAQFGIGIDLENMGWRTVATFAECVSVVEEAGQTNGAALLDVLHFCRNGGVSRDLLGARPGLIRSLQLCDAGKDVPRSADEMMREARSDRYAPGDGTLPVGAIVRALPPDVMRSVEVPIKDSADPGDHIQRLFESSLAVLNAAESGHLVSSSSPHGVE
jgi:sugar phosphate isomerase/epimerase